MAILIRMKSTKKDANGPVNQKYGKMGYNILKYNGIFFGIFRPAFIRRFPRFHDSE